MPFARFVQVLREHSFDVSAAGLLHLDVDQLIAKKQLQLHATMSSPTR